MLSARQATISALQATVCLNAPSGAGCFLTPLRSSVGPSRRGLNAPSGAGYFLTGILSSERRMPSSLNAPSGVGCFLTPASGNGVVAPLPGAGAPPAPQAPRGTGQHRPYLTTFRRPDAKRHRRHLEHLQPPASDDVKQKVDVPACDCGQILVWWWRSRARATSGALPPPSRLAAQLVKEMRVDCKSRQ